MIGPDDLFDLGLGLVLAALGTLAGALWAGSLPFVMFCSLAGVGWAVMISCLAASDLQHRRHMAENERQQRIIEENLPALQEAIVKGTLIGLIDKGREA